MFVFKYFNQYLVDKEFNKKICFFSSEANLCTGNSR